MDLDAVVHMYIPGCCIALGHRPLDGDTTGSWMDPLPSIVPFCFFSFFLKMHKLGADAYANCKLNRANERQMPAVRIM